jgi:hypothetical protein
MLKQPATTTGVKLRKHPHLMALNAFVWLDELSRRSGRKITLAQVPGAAWDRLKALGFDLIWLMGIWKRSPASRMLFRTDPSRFQQYDQVLPGWRLADVVGSPYSVQDYVPDPHLGGWDELDWVRNELHQRGMGLILDFVPNHTAPDHAWVETHPEFYVQLSEQDFRRNPASGIIVDRDPVPLVIARGKDPYFPPWPDTAQLNYFNPETRSAMAQTLHTIAQHSDGVRCDMAMLVVNDVFARTWGSCLSAFERPSSEFWPGLIAAMPDFLWIAEVYWDMEWQLQQMGFQFTYDKRLYDRLRYSAPQDILAHLRADLSFQSHLVRFIENHDEEPSAAAFPNQKLQAAATLIATLPGLRFYHHGQIEGRKISVPIALCRAAEQTPNQALQAFYERLLEISNCGLFHKGDWQLLDVHPAGDLSSVNLIGYRWTLRETMVVVVVNMAAQPSGGRIFIHAFLDHSQTYLLTDLLPGIKDERDGQELAENGIALGLDGWGCRIIEIRPQ